MSLARITVSYDGTSGGVYQNVYDVVVTPDFSLLNSPAILDDVVELVNHWYEPILANMANNVVFSEARVEEYTLGVTGLVHVADVPLIGMAGTAIAQGISAGVAGLVSCDALGHSYQARKYIAGLSEGAADENTWSAGALANLALFGLRWAGVFSGTSGSVFAPVLVSTGIGTIKSLVGAVTVDLTPAYQRRRKPGVGV